MCEDSIKLYLERLASNEPTPGGGSASALVGALGAALLEMVCNFTLGKEKFKPVEKEVAPILRDATSARQRLMELIKEDEAAYKPVASAYQMPKDTDQQRQKRKKAIEKTLEQSKKVPQEVKRLCERLLPYCDELVKKGNPMLASDARCAKGLLQAAVKGAENFV